VPENTPNCQTNRGRGKENKVPSRQKPRKESVDLLPTKEWFSKWRDGRKKNIRHGKVAASKDAAISTFREGRIGQGGVVDAKTC